MTEFTTAFLGASIGGGEALVIFFVFLLLFGPKKLPGMARNLGRMLSELRRASREVQNELLVADLPPPAVPPANRANPELPTPLAPESKPMEPPHDPGVS